MPNITKALKKAYDMDLNDQYVSPTVIGDYEGLNNYDGFIFWNFRKDRTEFMVRMFLDEIEGFSKRLQDSGDECYRDLNLFERVKYKKDLNLSTIKVCALVEYYKDIPCPVAFRAQTYEWSLGKFLWHFGFKQFRVSGVDKAKAVGLLSGGKVEKLFEREERFVIPRPEDMKSYMREYEEHKGEEGYKQDPYSKFPLLELKEQTKKLIELID